MMRWSSAPDLYEPPHGEMIQALNLVYLAKWAGVPVWELATQPVLWTDMIALAMEIEQSATRMKQREK